MTDREKVIKGLEHCQRIESCGDCPYQVDLDPDVGCEMPGDALALLREQEPVRPGWVSVKDRLPKDETEVVIIVQHKIGWYRAFAWHDEYGWHSSAEEFVDGESDFVTYWMPLPEPPKEVSGDG